MQTVLTSWKEIAQYMGKGVRTVQRWEECFGLPIRRLNAHGHHAVLAVPSEIDAWVRIRTEIQTQGTPTSEAERLGKRVVELEEENRFLRARLGWTIDEHSGERAEKQKDSERCTRLLLRSESPGQESRHSGSPQ